MSDLDTFRRLLRINKHRLDDELELQAEVMDRISDQISRLAASVDVAENDLKLTEARIFRQTKDLDEKITDKATENIVKRHSDRIKAFDRVVSARQDLAQWQGLHEAWKSRGYSINKLCDLYVAQYFTKNSHSISERSDRRRGEESALQDRKPYERRFDYTSSSTRKRITLNPGG